MRVSMSSIFKWTWLVRCKLFRDSRLRGIFKTVRRKEVELAGVSAAEGEVDSGVGEGEGGGFEGDGERSGGNGSAGNGLEEFGSGAGPMGGIAEEGGDGGD